MPAAKPPPSFSSSPWVSGEHDSHHDRAIPITSRRDGSSQMKTGPSLAPLPQNRKLPSVAVRASAIMEISIVTPEPVGARVVAAIAVEAPPDMRAAAPIVGSISVAVIGSVSVTVTAISVTVIEEGREAQPQENAAAEAE